MMHPKATPDAIAHVKSCALTAAKMFPLPTWEDFAAIHVCSQTENEIDMYELMALVLRLALDQAEQANDTLRQSMEDLVTETNEIKEKAKQVYIMGPGTNG